MRQKRKEEWKEGKERGRETGDWGGREEKEGGERRERER